MRSYQKSLLGQSSQFISLPVPKDHEMVVLSDQLDWDLLTMIGETRRDLKIHSTRGLKPHHRVLMGAVVVRALRGCDLRSAEDLIANYLPARYLCNLEDSKWNPDHNTIWEYEVMLGSEGLQEVNDYILTSASSLGFAEIEGLCSDTTAQEADIPYPNEVGHMNSFIKSLRKNIETVLKKSKGLNGQLVRKMKSVISKVTKKVREHRLFAKTKEARQKMNLQMVTQTGELLKDLGSFLENVDLATNLLKGPGKRGLNNLVDIYHNMSLMLPEIYAWIESGKVLPGKIISLFNTELRAITRGKAGKKVEFGLKWGVNQIRGGYISVYALSRMMSHDSAYSVQAIQEHIRIFGVTPKDFGFDRGAWSAPHMDEIQSMGVRNVGVAAKGKAKWRVGPTVQKRLTRERAQVEGKIGTIKSYGFNKSKAKSHQGVQRSAFRAGLCFNLKKFYRDLQKENLVKQAFAS